MLCEMEWSFTVVADVVQELKNAEEVLAIDTDAIEELLTSHVDTLQEKASALDANAPEHDGTGNLSEAVGSVKVIVVDAAARSTAEEDGDATGAVSEEEEEDDEGGNQAEEDEEVVVHDEEEEDKGAVDEVLQQSAVVTSVSSSEDKIVDYFSDPLRSETEVLQEENGDVSVSDATASEVADDPLSGSDGNVVGTEAESHGALDLVSDPLLDASTSQEQAEVEISAEDNTDAEKPTFGADGDVEQEDSESGVEEEESESEDEEEEEEDEEDEVDEEEDEKEEDEEEQEEDESTKLSPPISKSNEGVTPLAAPDLFGGSEPPLTSPFVDTNENPLNSVESKSALITETEVKRNESLPEDSLASMSNTLEGLLDNIEAAGGLFGTASTASPPPAMESKSFEPSSTASSSLVCFLAALFALKLKDFAT